jgi:hypothetical protein
MTYEYQEYPKALYRKGDYMSVDNAKEEKAAAKEGWTDWHTDHEQLTTAPATEQPKAEV